MRRHAFVFLVLISAILYSGALRGYAQQLRVELKPTMLTNEAEVGDPSGLIDEQREIIGPPAGKPSSTWELNSKYWKQFPFSAYLDLGEKKNLSSLWIYDTNCLYWKQCRGLRLKQMAFLWSQCMT